MKTRLLLLAMVSAVLLSAAPVLAEGDFYVIAGGGAPGTKISSLPYTINSPGFYYVAGNLSNPINSGGITVSVDDVTIDLMGFRLKGVAGTGVYIFGRTNVEVRNGTLSGWDFGLIDDNYSSPGYRNRALNLRVENAFAGISFAGTGNLIKGCICDSTTTGIYNGGGVTTGNTVTNNNYGIAAIGTISGNWASNCSYGIWCNGGSSIIGNTVMTTSANQTGIRIFTSDPVMVTQNTVSGPGTHFQEGSNTVNVANTNAGF
jgi:hypothetical protein